jgi:inosine-uridine nucleoside N-ribohydrolase
MNEIDDQFAIAYALGSAVVEVIGVISSQNTLVHGTASVHLYREEASKILELCGRTDVPCLIGAVMPLNSTHDPIPSEATEFLAQLVNSGTKYSILGTGPATDIASFRLLHPALAQSVPVIWAGSFPDEVTWKSFKYGELNARADIQAWRVLYSARYNLTVLPGWPGVVKVAVSSDAFVSELRAHKSRVATYLGDILEKWCDGKKTLDMDAVRGLKVLWDIVNVAYYSLPSALTLRSMPIPEIDASGSMYWNRIQGELPVCMDVDAEAIIRDFWQSLDNLPS